MKLRIDIVFGENPRRRARALIDIDPRSRLVDAEPLIHTAVTQALYERSRPNELVADALQHATPREAPRDCDCDGPLAFACPDGCLCWHHDDGPEVLADRVAVDVIDATAEAVEPTVEAEEDDDAADAAPPAPSRKRGG